MEVSWVYINVRGRGTIILIPLGWMGGFWWWTIVRVWGVDIGDEREMGEEKVICISIETQKMAF